MRKYVILIIVSIILVSMYINNNLLKQDIKFTEIGFSLPKQWYVEESRQSNYEEYYVKDVKGNIADSLTVTYLNNANIINEQNKILKSIEESKKNKLKLNYVKTEGMYVDNMKANEVMYSYETDSSTNYCEVLLIQVNENVIYFSFFSVGLEGQRVFKDIEESIYKVY